MLSKALSEDEI